MSACLAAICFAAGKMLADRQNQKYRSLENFVSLLSFLKIKMSFSLQPLGEIFEDASKKREFKTFTFLNTLCSRLESLSLPEAYRAALEASEFDEDTAAALAPLGDKLGVSNLSEQLDFIGGAEAMLTEKLKKLRDESLKNRKLYIGLGSLAGAALFIILI